MLNSKISIVSERIGPLWVKSRYRDTKDPCPVFDDKTWHIFGSGGSIGGEIQEEWDILHATAPNIEGPWTEQLTVNLVGLSGKHIAAPGVMYENGKFHMLVQTEYMQLGGTIEYLVSEDGGNTFVRQNTALESIPDTNEAALYDPHQAIINGCKYMTYSGSDFIGALEFEGAPDGWAPSVGRPDIFLAVSESNTWAGPWKRLGKILDHEDVSHHNQRSHLNYEWGLEGSQLIQLPNGIIVMNAACFLPHGEYGTRQRVFFAFASNVKGPYYTAGTVLTPSGDWEDGENGHAAMFLRGPDMILFYQGRPKHMHPWRYGIAYFNVRMLERIGKSTVRYYTSLERTATNRRRNELADTLGHTKPILTLTDFSRKIRSRLRKFQTPR